MAELSDRPFPPGSYPVVVVGSGPGGLQVSYCLSRFGIDHAVLSADDAPGGMFRRWPFFQRLLSWTKPFAPVARRDPAYQCYDWNSLLADEPENQAIMPGLMDGTSYFPSRPEMQQNLETFAARTGIRSATAVAGPGRAASGADGRRSSSWRRPTASTAPRSSSRSASPSRTCPTRPASSTPPTTSGRAPPRPTPKPRLHHRQAELRVRARLRAAPVGARIVLSSPSPAKLSVNTQSLLGVRARYIQPVEDHVLGGGVLILDAAISRIGRLTAAGSRSSSGPRAAARRSGRGRRGHCRDRLRLAAARPAGPRRDDVRPEPAAVDDAVLGERVGARPLLRGHDQPGLAGHEEVRPAGELRRGPRRPLQRPAPRPADRGDEVRLAGGARAAPDRGGRADRLGGVGPHDSPELFHQRAYLARVASLDPTRGPRDEGVVPLAAFLDATGGDATGDALAVTLEADGSGAIYPVVYSRRGGRLDESCSIRTRCSATTRRPSGRAWPSW